MIYVCLPLSIPPTSLFSSFSGSSLASDGQAGGLQVSDPVDEKAQQLVGTMSGDLQGLVEDDDEEDGKLWEFDCVELRDFDRCLLVRSRAVIFIVVDLFVVSRP